MNKKPPKQDKSYIGDLKRAATAKNPRIWIRRAITDDLLEAYFLDWDTLNTAERRHQLFPDRKSVVAEGI